MGRGGHRADGQALDARVRDGRAVVRPALAAGAQSVEPGAFHLRLVVRHRRGGGVRHDPGRHRLGHRRLDPRAGGAVRHRRHQADLWPGQPRGRAAAVVQHGPCGADGLDGGGLRAAAAGDGRLRSRGSGQRRSAGAGFHLRHRQGREGTAHRRGAAFLRDRQSGQSRDARRHQPRARRVRASRRGDQRGEAVADGRVPRLRLDHPDVGGVCGPRAVAEDAVQRLRRTVPRPACAGRLHPRHRLRAGDAPAPHAVRGAEGGDGGLRHPGVGLAGDRGAEDHRGAKVGHDGEAVADHAVQPDRLSGDERVHGLRCGRAAGVDAVDRQAVRRGDAVPGGTRLRDGGGHPQAAADDGAGRGGGSRRGAAMGLCSS